ncbi:hypothetical protein [Bacillus atrophaeus]|uniref:hypothetical protein n=1 Tax=Bacillus atrophaeus TaxID=1452 RepID=UPI00227F0495|nr:hypothetical protein [Bacillus atrophaeus]MCY8497605.1 hypothetical protein [Bacillus atrophaeus]MCY8814307.1 hypothetical protein [Bacillus atrophaeus]MCY8816163.1 hypothetical protein [Bacillus atrophaeus]MCY8823096.1 hypothetical protein [Bacillus atrophaeus]MCY8828690.1 hypothetical protein [Bacillus atrophaeus]
MNYVKNKQVKKQLEQCLKANKEVVSFLEHLQENHSFSDKENEGLYNCCKHVSNMSFVFEQMKKTI